MNIPTLSFCITCKNRLEQIKQTLPQNLKDNALFGELVDFVVVDFSTQGLREWINDNFEKELASGYLKYYYTEELPNWNASIAKNTSHNLANNDILVNLDCDNYTGTDGGWFVIRQFLTYGMDIVLHQASDDSLDGAFGRISVSRELFKQVGGYDESFAPVAYQDIDIIDRLKATGCRYVRIKENEYNKAIYNTKEFSIVYTDSSLKTWDEMDTYNRKLSHDNLVNRRFVANDGNFGIHNNIFDINGRLITFDKPKKSKLSFNITCMNRLHHLKQTLEPNMLKNCDPERVEFVLLDYNSTDGLEDWMKQQHTLFDTGMLTYYKTLEPTHYHRTHSRNMAFRLSTGDIVCNLDADNFLSENYAQCILDLFDKEKQPFFTTPQYTERDVIGRVCMRREHFLLVNGYDEALPGYGLEDIDLYD